MSRPSARTDTARPTTSAGLQSTSVASNDLRALVTTHGCHYRLPNTTSDPTQQRVKDNLKFCLTTEMSAEDFLRASVHEQLCQLFFRLDRMEKAFNQQVLALEQGEKEMIRERLAAILFSVTTTDLTNSAVITNTIAAALRIQSGRDVDLDNLTPEQERFKARVKAFLSSKNVDDAKNKLKTKVNDASKSLKEVAKLFKGGSALDRLKHACIMRLANRCRVGNNGDRTNWSLVSAIMERTKQNRAEADRLVAWEHLFSDLRTVYDAVIESDIEPDAVPAFSDVDFCVRYCTCLTISNDHAVSLSFDHQRDDATNGGHIGADFETALLEWRPEEAAANDQAAAATATTGRRLEGRASGLTELQLSDFILDDGSAAVSDENVDGHRFSIEEHEAVQPPTQHRRLHTPATPLARRNSFARDPQPSTYTPHMGQSQRHDPRASDDELYFSDEQYTGDNRPGAVRPISGGRPSGGQSTRSITAQQDSLGLASQVDLSRVSAASGALRANVLSRAGAAIEEGDASEYLASGTQDQRGRKKRQREAGSPSGDGELPMPKRTRKPAAAATNKQPAEGEQSRQASSSPSRAAGSQRQANKGKGRAGRHAKHSVNERDIEEEADRGNDGGEEDGVEEDGAEEDTAQAKKVVALRKQGNRRSTRSRT